MWHAAQSGTRYLGALSAATAYGQASAVAIDRYGGGVRRDDAYHMIAQQAAAYVYLADLAGANARLARAGRVLGALLVKSGRDLTFSAKQVQRIRNDLLHLKGVPHALRAELRREGIAPTAADVVAALRAAFTLAGPPHAVRLSTVLGERPRLAGLVKQAEGLSPLHLQALVDTLAGQHLSSRRTRAILQRSVERSGLPAMHARRRARAARRFISAVALRTHGKVKELLAQAGQLLTEYDRGVSAPLPLCKKADRKHGRSG